MSTGSPVEQMFFHDQNALVVKREKEAATTSYTHEIKKETFQDSQVMPMK